MPIIVIGSMRFPSDNLASVQPHLRELVDATRSRDGCIAYDAAFDPLDPGVVRFSEIWPDMATLRAHLEAPHIAPWREVAGKYGVSERNFVAWEAASPQPV